MKNLILLITIATVFVAQESIEFKGNIFFDAYYSGSNNSQAVDNASGMWIRRVYLTADKTFSDAFSSSVRWN